MTATPKLAVLPILFVSMLGYLGLAVLAFGSVSGFFCHPALVALSVILFALTAASAFTQGNLSAGEREDRSNRWVLAALGGLGLLLAVVPAYCDRRDWWTLDGAVVRWLGVVLFGVGGTLRLWPVFVLGRRFSGLVAIQPGHTLVTSGVYHYIRHPSYLGLLVGSAGWTLAFRSGPGLLLVALMIPPLLARIHAEEGLLASQFGEAYRAYRSHTARLIPGLF